MSIVEIGRTADTRDPVVDDEMKSALVSGVLRALWSTLGSAGRFRSPNGVGMERYDSVVQEVSYELVERLGFQRSDNGCQVRLESRDRAVRILMCKGSREECQILRVSKKGKRARKLVDENAPFVSQLGLWCEEESPRSQEEAAYRSFWLVWDVTGPYGDEVAITLALPVALNESGTAFVCEDMLSLYRGGITAPAEASAEMPSVSVIPTIEEVAESCDTTQG